MRVLYTKFHFLDGSFLCYHCLNLIFYHVFLKHNVHAFFLDKLTIADFIYLKYTTCIDKNLVRIAHNFFLNKHQLSQHQLPIVADEFVYSYVNVHAEYQPIRSNDYHAIPIINMTNINIHM